MSLRIIGCGNPDRGDDAAGILVARRLRILGIEAEEQSGETFALLESWHGSENVILVDSTCSGHEPGHVQVWDALTNPPPKDALPCSTHAFGVREAIELARVMDCLPRKLVIYGIEGRQFVFGTPMSFEVARAVEPVTQLIFKLARPITA